MKVLKSLSIFALVLVMLVAATACGKKQGTTAPTTTAAPTTQAPTTAAPTTTAPTATEEEGEMVEPFEAAVDLLTTYYSIGENLGWEGAVYLIGEGYTGQQYVTFLATPLVDKVDGSIGFADFDKTVTGFSDLSIMVRMNADGMFDVRNGDNFEKLADVAYEVDAAYFVELYADMAAKTYTVYVTPDGGERTLIAENYAFRTTANDADDLGKVFFVAAGGNDKFTVDALKRFYLYEAGREYYSTGENFGWQQEMISLGKEYTGKIKIEYDHTCLIDSVDSSVDFTDGSFDVYGFSDLAMLVRMRIGDALFDVRNGDAFESIANVPVVKDVKNHIEIEADIDAKTYSVWVTPAGGVRTQIAKDYVFRTTANHADSIGQCVVISAHEDDSTKMENLVITEMNGGTTPVPTTVAPTTTKAPTTTAAPTTTKSSTTAAPTTTAAQTTTKAPTTTTAKPTSAATPTTTDPELERKTYAAATKPIKNMADYPNVGPLEETSYMLDKYYTGKLTIKFDMKALVASPDANVGFVGSSVVPYYQKAYFAHYYSHHSIMVAIVGSEFRAINGDNWATAPGAVKDKVYHVRIEADMNAHNYTVFISADGVPEFQVGEVNAFRTRSRVAGDPAYDLAPVIDDIAMVVVAGNNANEIQIDNLVITQK